MDSNTLRAALDGAVERPIKIACIGSSSERTGDELAFCRAIGRALAVRGAYIGSGNAEQSDEAYAQGANEVAPERVVLYLPREGHRPDAIHPRNQIRTPPYPAYYERLVAELHPAYEMLVREGRTWTLENHVRNVGIVKHSVAVIAYPRYGSKRGGTGMGMDIGSHLGIPVYDLTQPEARHAVARALDIPDDRLPGELDLFGPPR